MPLTKSKSRASFSKNVSAEMSAGKPQNQALAIAYRVQREAKAIGGGVSSPPFYVRNEARDLEHAGMIHSPVAGRTDRLPMSVRSNSYVIPADVVSAVGQGNSMAGASALNRLFKMGPYGSAAAGVPGAQRPHFADGGDVPTDIVAAGGEFVVPPEKVTEIGNGDVDHGHSVLDAMVKHIRNQNIKTLRTLPGPKKG